MLLDQDLSVPPDLKYASIRVGIRSSEIFSYWLSRGFHGSMSYLSTDDRLQKRTDTSLLFPGARSIVVFLLNYKTRTIAREGFGRIASYASFEDYHRFFPRIIDDFMTENGLFRDNHRTYVDTGPLGERELAMRSSIGWIGKNSMLINPSLGSFTFIGVSVTDVPLDYPSTPVTDLCGNCMRCITSCPTGAINVDRTINSNLCISYQTIENRGIIPKEVSDRMDDMIFGCDICNDVCPWNREKHESSLPIVERSLFSNRLRLEEIAFIDKTSFDEAYRGSAIKRATHEGFARNALIALHNTNREDVVEEASKQFSDLRRDQALLLLDKNSKRT